MSTPESIVSESRKKGLAEGEYHCSHSSLSSPVALPSFSPSRPRLALLFGGKDRVDERLIHFLHISFTLLNLTLRFLKLYTITNLAGQET
jgi:hypothetical protein